MNLFIATPDSGMDIGQELPSRTRGERHNLLNNYLSALLIIFLDCGLVEVTFPANFFFFDFLAK